MKNSFLFEISDGNFAIFYSSVFEFFPELSKFLGAFHLLVVVEVSERVVFEDIVAEAAEVHGGFTKMIGNCWKSLSLPKIWYFKKPLVVQLFFVKCRQTYSVANETTTNKVMTHTCVGDQNERNLGIILKFLQECKNLVVLVKHFWAHTSNANLSLFHSVQNMFYGTVHHSCGKRA